MSNDINFSTDAADAVISDITPSTWQADGNQFSITITGSNFGNHPTIHIADPSDITYGSNPTVNGDGSLTTTVTVPSSETATQASLYVQPGSVGCTGNCWASSDPSDPSAKSAPTSVPITVPTVTNFQRTTVTDVGGGTLSVAYTWASSTGHLKDLKNCSVREVVTYPGAGSTYTWSTPPYPARTDANPKIYGGAAGNATGGAASDKHLPYQQNAGLSFVKPYIADAFTATQKFQFMCTNFNSGSWNDLLTGASVTRTVSQNPNSSWKYTATEFGVSGSINPMP